MGELEILVNDPLGSTLIPSKKYNIQGSGHIYIELLKMGINYLRNLSLISFSLGVYTQPTVSLHYH